MKTIAISDDSHTSLKILSATLKTPMGDIVEGWIKKKCEENSSKVDKISENIEFE